jgi:hypothetical protein
MHALRAALGAHAAAEKYKSKTTYIKFINPI